MKKSGVLNGEISRIIAKMGHSDLLVICDAGFPIPDDVTRIDLALLRGVPSVIQTVTEVAKELEVEQVIYSLESDQHCVDLINDVTQVFPTATSVAIKHEDFKVLSGKAKAIIRTGEFVPYANIILRAGVVF